jgi:hypothetical protein
MFMLRDKRLVILITANHLKALKAKQKATGASVGEIVRRAIEQYLK